MTTRTNRFVKPLISVILGHGCTEINDIIIPLQAPFCSMCAYCFWSCSHYNRP
ncbi:uncharacterized protein BJ212DRAFT_1346869 [Suillus subaureus]|uniref:Uncharacterized protein n=1 Tax=Suillus subaureus TaxID=48587 RepID=A0A9P7JF15_9AGAM|nr:uncharacterized protein BJ212DRAFT_1346869 [Suillus subaureus]KAG1818673.1 hypothetical protein BJ212DRAFT_1346869 [Suillus subaureus]